MLSPEYGYKLLNHINFIQHRRIIMNELNEDFLEEVIELTQEIKAGNSCLETLEDLLEQIQYMYENHGL